MQLIVDLNRANKILIGLLKKKITEEESLKAFEEISLRREIRELKRETSR